MDDQCRLCMERGIIEKHDIFQESSFIGDIPLHVKIVLCCSLSVTMSDGLPRSICNECFCKLTMFYEFKEQCFKNYRQFLKASSKHVNSLESEVLLSLNNQILVLDDVQKQNDSNFTTKTFGNDITEETNSVTDSSPNINNQDTVELYQCTTCKVIFETVTQVDQHACISKSEEVKVQEKLVNNIYECSYCDRKYRSKSQVNLHEKVHKGSQPHKCSYCKKSFLRPSDKMKHERTHTGESPFLCKICHKTFKQMGGLVSHEHAHTNKLKCTLCSLTFSNVSSYKRHQNKHKN